MSFVYSGSSPEKLKELAASIQNTEKANQAPDSLLTLRFAGLNLIANHYLDYGPELIDTTIQAIVQSGDAAHISVLQNILFDLVLAGKPVSLNHFARTGLTLSEISHAATTFFSNMDNRAKTLAPKWLAWYISALKQEGVGEDQEPAVADVLTATKEIHALFDQLDTYAKPSLAVDLIRLYADLVQKNSRMLENPELQLQLTKLFAYASGNFSPVQISGTLLSFYQIASQMKELLGSQPDIWTQLANKFQPRRESLAQLSENYFPVIAALPDASYQADVLASHALGVVATTSREDKEKYPPEFERMLNILEIAVGLQNVEGVKAVGVDLQKPFFSKHFDQLLKLLNAKSIDISAINADPTSQAISRIATLFATLATKLPVNDLRSSIKSESLTDEIIAKLLYCVPPEVWQTSPMLNEQVQHGHPLWMVISEAFPAKRMSMINYLQHVTTHVYGGNPITMIAAIDQSGMLSVYRDSLKNEALETYYSHKLNTDTWPKLITLSQRLEQGTQIDEPSEVLLILEDAIRNPAIKDLDYDGEQQLRQVILLVLASDKVSNEAKQSAVDTLIAMTNYSYGMAADQVLQILSTEFVKSLSSKPALYRKLVEIFLSLAEPQQVANAVMQASILTSPKVFEKVLTGGAALFASQEAFKSVATAFLNSVRGRMADPNSLTHTERMILQSMSAQPAWLALFPELKTPTSNTQQ